MLKNWKTYWGTRARGAPFTLFVLDIDGTVARLPEGVKPTTDVEWNNLYAQATPRVWSIRAASYFMAEAHQSVILTGRSVVNKAQTVHWMRDQLLLDWYEPYIPRVPLIMREINDHRQHTRYKVQNFHNLLRKYNPDFAIVMDDDADFREAVSALGHVAITPPIE
jgi:hypothetical protein